MINAVIAAVKEAAKLAVNAHYTICSKGSSSNVVTDTDVAIQNLLQKRFEELLPQSGFLGEESDPSKLGAEYIWVIDPIDGTMNFTRGIRDSAISVALLKNGECVLGVVYNFATDDLYHAEHGKGAYRNGQPIHVSKRPFAEGLLCTAMSLYKKEIAPLCFDIISELYMQSNDIRRLGSCALELCYIAEGKCDLYFEIRVFAWDCAAGELILREAGAHVYRFFPDGYLTKPLPLIAANSAENLEVLRSVVQKHFDKYGYRG